MGREHLGNHFSTADYLTLPELQILFFFNVAIIAADLRAIPRGTLDCTTRVHVDVFSLPKWYSRQKQYLSEVL